MGAREPRGGTVEALVDGSERVLETARVKRLIGNSPRQRKTAVLPGNVGRASEANRTGIPDALRSGVERLSGVSLADVRVQFHSSEPAKLGAHAFTRGRQIHVAPGQERHLPHEAWHAVQQMQGRVRPTGSVGGVEVNDDARLEKEADRMGEKAARLGSRGAT